MKKLGDLYWQQLSMWDFSKKEDVDKFNDKGSHFELLVVTESQIGNRWKAKNLTWEELQDSGLDLSTLVPEPNHNWSRVMGNISNE